MFPEVALGNDVAKLISPPIGRSRTKSRNTQALCRAHGLDPNLVPAAELARRGRRGMIPEIVIVTQLVILHPL